MTYNIEDSQYANSVFVFQREQFSHNSRDELSSSSSHSLMKRSINEELMSRVKILEMSRQLRNRSHEDLYDQRDHTDNFQTSQQHLHEESHVVIELIHTLINISKQISTIDDSLSNNEQFKQSNQTIEDSNVIFSSNTSIFNFFINSTINIQSDTTSIESNDLLSTHISNNTHSLDSMTIVSSNNFISVPPTVESTVSESTNDDLLDNCVDDITLDDSKISTQDNDLTHINADIHENDVENEETHNSENTAIIIENVIENVEKKEKNDESENIENPIEKEKDNRFEIIDHNVDDEKDDSVKTLRLTTANRAHEDKIKRKIEIIVK